MNTPHDHDHNDMTPLDYALAHNDQLIKRLAGAESDLEFRRDLYALQTEQLDKVRSELVDARNEIMEQARLLGAGGSREAALISKLDTEIKQRELWQQEAKRWRDMYLEYDEMLEGDLEKAKKRIASVISKIKELDKEMNDGKF
jgi:chromosome segregation ATPase